jgi:hypothetical protein
MFSLMGNEAEQKTFCFVPHPKCGVVSISVKGQDERPSDALDRDRHHSESRNVQSRTAATSALTFMTFS